MLGVSPNTVTRWAREGRLPCQVTLGGTTGSTASSSSSSARASTEPGAALTELVAPRSSRTSRRPYRRSVSRRFRASGAR